MAEMRATMEGGSVPVPDPTLRTGEQLFREIANARELIESKIEGLHHQLSGRCDGLDNAREALRAYLKDRVEGGLQNISTRIDGMDRAISLLQTISDRVSSLTDEKVDQLKRLHQEKFDSIAVQFAERDTRTEQTAAGVKIAVDAALQAAKEAVAEQNRSFALATGKSETATMKQIDALGLAIQNANKTLDDKIADMKERLTRIEGMDLGTTRRDLARTTEAQIQHSGNQNLIGIVAAVISGIAAIAAVVAIAITIAREPTPLPRPVGLAGSLMFRNSVTYPWDGY